MEPYRTLIVDPDATMFRATEALQKAGFEVSTVKGFRQAVKKIADQPVDALVTELRLGDFNGLHLIIRLRHQCPGAAAVIYTSFPDPVLERQAHQLDADYLVRDDDAAPLVELITARLTQADRRVKVRKRIDPPMAVHLADIPGRLLDISQDGLCVEFDGTVSEPNLELRVRDEGVTLTARIVWTRHQRDGLSGVRFGATIGNLPQEADRWWRRLVESA